jgi:hypothetical protein
MLTLLMDMDTLMLIRLRMDMRLRPAEAIMTRTACGSRRPVVRHRLLQYKLLRLLRHRLPRSLRHRLPALLTDINESCQLSALSFQRAALSF